MNIKGRVLAMVSACVVIFSQSSIATFALDNQEVLTLPTSVSETWDKWLKFTTYMEQMKEPLLSALKWSRDM